MSRELNNLDLALAHHQKGELASAADLYQQVLQTNPEHPDALYLFGCLLYQSGRTTEALKRLQRAAELAPNQAEYHNAAGLAFNSLKQHREAAESFHQAIRLAPNHIHALTGLADALLELGQASDAAAAYRKALDLNPHSAKAWYGCGCAENLSAEFALAQDCFAHAIELQPDWLEARHNLARALYELGLVTEAFEQFNICAEMNQPGSVQSRAMLAIIVPGVPAIDNTGIRNARQNWAERDLPQTTRRPKRKKSASPLRIAYISSFFQRDNWMKPVWGLINQHNRQAVQVNLFSDCAASDIQHGYQPHKSDRYFDTSKLSNFELSRLINQSAIDVLIDLNGYSNRQRLPLFCEELSPVVIGWFNFYATSGMLGFDYLIGDAEVVLPGEEQFYTEKILQVEGSYLTFNVNYPVPPVNRRSAELVFGSLASAYKITGEVVEAWARILHACPGSALLLKNKQLNSAGGREFLTARFQQHGVTPDRLQLEGSASHFDFLRAYDRIDIALDTFPYNGGTTTTEAIWQGVPVVTYYGDRWAARTSASILRAAGLAEFVAADLDGYVQLAIRLASSALERERLTGLRANLREHLAASSVCNTARFARQMEALYEQVANAM